MPKNPYAGEQSRAAKSLRQSYRVAYAQHVPMEPRAAAAQWSNGKLTVWTGTQNPFGVRDELMEAFHLKEDSVRVIATDCGCGFGGKHTRRSGGGGGSIGAGRRQAGGGSLDAGRGVHVGLFPAGGGDRSGSGAGCQRRHRLLVFCECEFRAQAIEPPYRTGKKVDAVRAIQAAAAAGIVSSAGGHGQYVRAGMLYRRIGRNRRPRRAGIPPGPFAGPAIESGAGGGGHGGSIGKIARKAKEPNIGVGLACGTEKDSYVAACAEVEVDQKKGRITVRRVCQAFDCGAIVNPDNLRKQVAGAVIMGLGPALWEEMRFEEGKILNPALSKYYVPHIDDVPELEVHLLDRPEEKSVGAGETPTHCHRSGDCQRRVSRGRAAHARNADPAAI